MSENNISSGRSRAGLTAAIAALVAGEVAILVGGLDTTVRYAAGGVVALALVLLVIRLAVSGKDT